jgi:hypothetical protein
MESALGNRPSLQTETAVIRHDILGNEKMTFIARLHEDRLALCSFIDAAETWSASLVPSGTGIIIGTN